MRREKGRTEMKEDRWEKILDRREKDRNKRMTKGKV